MIIVDHRYFYVLHNRHLSTFVLYWAGTSYQNYNTLFPWIIQSECLYAKQIELYK